MAVIAVPAASDRAADRTIASIEKRARSRRVDSAPSPAAMATS